MYLLLNSCKEKREKQKNKVKEDTEEKEKERTGLLSEMRIYRNCMSKHFFFSLSQGIRKLARFVKRG